jgi:PadR family transcriptional regulator, regulatory protein PadR
MAPYLPARGKRAVTGPTRQRPLPRHYLSFPVLLRLDDYLYLDRLTSVVRDRALFAQASSVLGVMCAEPLMWRHGYDIARKTGLEPGTMYSILIGLADGGLLEACWEDEQPGGRPRRHLYRLTMYQPSHVRHSGTSGDDGPAHPVLASDLEREQTLQMISHAVGEGRLNLDEAERRIEVVLHSRHCHELAGLVGDLPQRALSQPCTRGGSSPLRVGLVALAAVTILAAVVVQAVASLWELWPVAVVGCGLWAARARR